MGERGEEGEEGAREEEACLFRAPLVRRLVTSELLLDRLRPGFVHLLALALELLHLVGRALLLLNLRVLLLLLAQLLHVGDLLLFLLLRSLLIAELTL